MPRSQQVGQGPWRFTALASFVLGCFLAPGCGGEVAGDSVEAGGSTSTPDASATAGASVGTAGASGASTVSACGAASPLQARLAWEGIGYDGYAFSPGYFGFSPDGLTLESPARTGTSYEVETGAVLGTGGVPVVFRNREWTREVAGGQVLDVESQTALLQVSTAGVAALSGDGRYFFWLDASCVAGSRNVYRRSVDSHEQEALALSGFCDAGRLPTLSVTETGSAALAATGSGRLWRADFEHGGVSSVEAHPLAANGNGLSVAFSPDERFIAVLGADQRLRTFTYPDLAPGAVDMPSASTYAFSWCYCRSLWFAPVAWSPDGSLLASADETGHVVVRRACDGQALATLASPEPVHPSVSPPRPAELGPMYLAFAPTGAGLAVGFEGGLKYFALAAAE